jgi:hypothetical protein
MSAWIKMFWIETFWVKTFCVQTFWVKTWVDLVGFAAEIVGHHHEGRNHALIIHRRRYPKAEGGLATQIRTTHHSWNSPVYLRSTHEPACSSGQRAK